MKTKFAAVMTGLTMAVSIFSTLPAHAIAAPMGAQIFCIKFAQYCHPDSRNEVRYSEDLLATMASVNKRVNGSMRYVADRGVIDDWRVGGSTGDCEDYALTKRARLISKGIPAGALRVAATKTRRGVPHAVLIVRTDQGDFVLDNLSGSVKTRGQSGYRINMLASNDPRVWVRG